MTDNQLITQNILSQITDIFFIVDEFAIEFRQNIVQSLIGNIPKRKPRMSMSEIMTIMILFQLSNIRNFKVFYILYVKQNLVEDFPKTVSYNRFVELQKQMLLPMAVFAKTSCLGECSGISFIDSTPLSVCKNKRIFNHKVFKGIATRMPNYGLKTERRTNCQSTKQKSRRSESD
jgi:hypothetical protein